ncbi:DUF2716 domain-containing protein [Jannaschia sp. Os4]|uniref:DUF2716 domain-containing protein n=1 Tax=Jannaschia sp. Os4 TaxID=2807617 RepID=UPI00193AC8A3|nr:DUF2716 domain-containing protein [Jannaschia sp. Os4]MBM2574772.1 DUF2716 domain-containing protein [Jannaschia sp. Os4]
MKFRPSISVFPGFEEPRPSVTYGIEAAWTGLTAADTQVLTDLETKALAAFRAAAGPACTLWALDWQHACYAFRPSAARPDDPWPIPALPDGDYHLFLDPGLRFGWLGHPWEQTICLFGAPLLAALKRHCPLLLRDPVRRKD